MKTIIYRHLRKTLVIVMISIISTLFSSCSQHNYTTLVESDGKTVLVGSLKWDDWKAQAGWDSYTADNTEFDYLKVKLIAKFVNAGNYKFLLFGGSWCGDSKSQMPIIYKLFDSAGFSEDKITLFGLDRQKQEPTGIATKYNIERVPTFVILEDNREKGRIVEYPEKSWEDDILKILMK